MRLSEFDFALPPERIAHHPARPRDAARLLVVGDALHDRLVRDLPRLLRPGDALVANDTRVIPAQLRARRGEARIGLTLDRPHPDGTWHALARNARRLRPGDRLAIDGADDLAAMRRLPLTYRLPGLVVTHASLRSVYDSVEEDTPEAALREMFKAPETFIVRGHNHGWLERRWDDRTLVTVASCGLPLKGRLEAGSAAPSRSVACGWRWDCFSSTTAPR